MSGTVDVAGKEKRVIRWSHLPAYFAHVTCDFSLDCASPPPPPPQRRGNGDVSEGRLAGLVTGV